MGKDTDKEYSESMLKNFVTRIGHTAIKNLELGPHGGSLRTLMTVLRDRKTESREFRSIAKEVYSTYVFPELAESFHTKNNSIVTRTNVPYDGKSFVPQEIVLIDIPTAGTAATELLMDKLNFVFGDTFDIHKAVIDITRIEEGNGIRYDKRRVKIRDIGMDAICVIPDIMLASGGTCVSAIEELMSGRHFKKGGGLEKIVIAPLISSTEGALAVTHSLDAFGIQSEIVSAAIDPGLNERKYIIPGLGDAGSMMNNRHE